MANLPDRAVRGGLGRGGRGWPVPLSPPVFPHGAARQLRETSRECRGTALRARRALRRGARCRVQWGYGAAGRASVPGSGTHLRAEPGRIW